MPGDGRLVVCTTRPAQTSVAPFRRLCTWLGVLGIIAIQPRCETEAERLSRIITPALVEAVVAWTEVTRATMAQSPVICW